VGMKDPNPKVSGKGFRSLRAKGIPVVSKILKNECLKLNEPFVKVIKTGMPYVILKSAMSLDGKIATSSGDSKWISGELARKRVHQIRSHVDAIMVGTKTVLKDNPRLTCRLGGKIIKNPVRIILDRRSRIPLSANVFKNSKSERIIYVVGPNVSASRKKSLAKKNIEVLRSASGRNGFQIKPLLRKLAGKEINSILIEGGSELSASVLKANAVDRVIAFISPIIIGGSQAPDFVGGKSAMKMADGIKLNNFVVKKIGEDLMVEGTLCSAE
jgi:diaminohydroxyphosphoribosylaminopyrimidine deaminase / 5-amino-6-(5-phosphoribosylamino)uracil reductase